MRIGVDAMGGDFAPRVVVQGAVDALRLISDQSKIVLFGDSEQIVSILKECNCSADKFEIVHTSEVIEMSDHPAQAFNKKQDSSIAVGFKYLQENKIDGFASAGSTGAMLVGSVYSIKQIEGVIRPTISSLIPTLKGQAVLLDVGLNVDCKPEVLYQYGILGSIYARRVLGIENPRVALLNIGEEKEKGNIATKAAHELMESTKDFNFVGNVEGVDLFTGEVADVIVCDGFAGNTVLKQAEGFYKVLSKLGVRNDFIEQMNYEHVGGTPVLGINSVVTIGHGCSSALAITNMILATEKAVEANFVKEFKDFFS